MSGDGVAGTPQNSRRLLPYRHAVLKFVIAERDNRLTGLEVAADGDPGTVIGADLHIDAVCFVLGDDEYIGALSIAQHRRTRHRQTMNAGECDLTLNGGA